MMPLDSIEDFTLLLFIHIARVDGSLHPNEKDVILEELNRLFPRENYWQNRFAEMDAYYNKMGNAHGLSLLKDHLGNFYQVEFGIKARIHKALYNIVNANGRVSEEEVDTLQVFKGWLTAL